MSFRLVIALSALLGAGSLAAQTAAPAESSSAATLAAAPAAAAELKPGDATAGQAKTAVCAACHGMDGNSASALYPKLAGQHESYIVNQLELFKSGKRANPIMAGFAAPLSEQDMRDIGAYFASKTSLPGVADAKLVPQGEAYFHSGDAQDKVPACMACHGPDGRGNPGAGYPQLAGQHADYVAARLKAFRDGSAGGDARTQIMDVVAKNLSDADIAALASYVEGLHAVDTNTAVK
ncbi:MAG: c-type cytochrome [Rudaea sp.]